MTKRKRYKCAWCNLVSDADFWAIRTFTVELSDEPTERWTETLHFCNHDHRAAYLYGL